MDDYSIASLNESKNEWCIRLVNILTYHIIDGFKSIFSEAWKICKDDDEMEKYLMTFQNLLSKIPEWNETIIETERSRIIEKSNCNYIEDLLTCVHIIQLKALTCVRVSSQQKKIDLEIPKLDIFIHKVYISIARKLYINIYLFERNIPPLEMQKRNREFELIVKESIMNTVRDNIPIDNILRAYIDETEELNVSEQEEIVKVNNLETDEEKEKAEKQTQEDEKRKEEQEELDRKKEELVKKEEELKKTEDLKKEDLKMNDKPSIIINKDNVNTGITIEKKDTLKEATTLDDSETIDIPNKISFNPTTEAVSVDGTKETKDLINDPPIKPPTLYDDEDDGDKIKIGDSLNLDDLISEDLSDKKMNLSKPSLDIEVLT
tara:strand:- start:14221 stop:15351 length:1131 start_codon:yes stop_codon:yes gene_type:complete